MTLSARAFRFYPVIILILAFAELSFFSYLKPFRLHPDLLLVSVVLAGFSFRIRWALLIGLYAGILKDAFTFYPQGLHALLFPLAGFWVIKLSRKISFDEMYVKIILIFLLAFCLSLAKGLAFFFYGWPISFPNLLGTALLSSVSCAFFSFFLIRILEQ